MVLVLAPLAEIAYRKPREYRQEFSQETFNDRTSKKGRPRPA
jgi:hypothetical protein